IPITSHWTAAFCRIALENANLSQFFSLAVLTYEMKLCY
ncbi:hypothetical protein CP02DC21_1479, partial [Chlamydia psittaci 02DC21]